MEDVFYWSLGFFAVSVIAIFSTWNSVDSRKWKSIRNAAIICFVPMVLTNFLLGDRVNYSVLDVTALIILVFALANAWWHRVTADSAEHLKLKEELIKKEAAITDLSDEIRTKSSAVKSYIAALEVGEETVEQIDTIKKLFQFEKR